jgi:LCP family protein required for cell wall assembly
MAARSGASDAASVSISGGFLGKAVFGLFFLVFLAGGVYFGGVFLGNLAKFADVPTLTSLADLPAVALAPLTGAPPPAPEAAGPDWSQKERVNILILGTDGRPDEGDLPVRSDTLMVLTIDPYAKTAGVISFPRDLWVTIPTGDKTTTNDRINVACALGDYLKLPDGCAGVARRTVEANFGIKIHYYALMDFSGFERMIDALGGVNIDVEKPIKDDEYPTADYGTMRVYIPAGLQHMDGRTALIYARTRHADSDFGRMHRQQQLMVAARQRALQLDIFPRLPALYGELKDAVKTDMSFPDMLAVANAGRELDMKNVQFRAIEGPYIQELPGQFVFLPNKPAIQRLLDEMFVDRHLQNEAARVEVLNGTAQSGLASRVAGALREKGYASVTFANADAAPPETTIIDLTGKSYTAKKLAELFPGAKVISRSDFAGGADIQLILGDGAKVP